jgi:hypothetical protein
MFTPRLAIFYLATILRLSHVCGVECHACGVVACFSNILYVGAAARWCLGPQERSSRLLPHYHRDDNMDRATKVVAQGVPPGVPRSYRALADHGHVPGFNHLAGRRQYFSNVTWNNERRLCWGCTALVGLLILQTPAQ